MRNQRNYFASISLAFRIGFCMTEKKCRRVGDSSNKFDYYRYSLWTFLFFCDMLVPKGGADDVADKKNQKN